MARSANLLVNKRSGRTGSYGLVLENLLHAKGQNFHPTNSAIRAKAGGNVHTSSTAAAGLSSPSAHGSSGLNAASSSVVTANVATKDLHSPSPKNAAAGTTTHVSTASSEGRHHSRASSPVN